MSIFQLFLIWYFLQALLLHHIAVSSSFALGAILQTYLFELAVALLTEVNSIFLHLRTLLKVSGGSDIKTTSSYRLVALANIATFFTCRFEHFSAFFFAYLFGFSMAAGQITIDNVLQHHAPSVGSKFKRTPPGVTALGSLDIVNCCKKWAEESAPVFWPHPVTLRILVFLWLGLRLLVMKTSLAPAIYVMFWSGLAIVAIISVIHFRRLLISDFFTPTSFSNGDCRKDKTSWYKYSLDYYWNYKVYTKRLTNDTKILCLCILREI